MNELQTKLIESVDNIQKWINTAGEFVEEQSPIVVQEIIRWGEVKNITSIVVCIILAVVMFFLWKFLIKAIQKGSDVFPLVLPLVIASLANLMFLVSFVYKYIFVMCAPRLYILEELSKIIR